MQRFNEIFPYNFRKLITKFSFFWADKIRHLANWSIFVKPLHFCQSWIFAQFCHYYKILPKLSTIDLTLRINESHFGGNCSIWQKMQSFDSKCKICQMIFLWGRLRINCILCTLKHFSLPRIKCTHFSSFQFVWENVEPTLIVKLTNIIGNS